MQMGRGSRSKPSMVEEEERVRRSPMDGYGWDQRRQTGEIQIFKREAILARFQRRRRGGEVHGGSHSNDKMRGEGVEGNVSMATTMNPGRRPQHQQEK